MIVLERDELRAFDRWAIDELGIESLVLMENAARGVVDEIGRRWPEARAVILCGPGNNGADGLAIARLLTLRHVVVRVVLLAREASERDPSSEVARQLAWAEALGIEILDELPALDSGDLVVDALFGSGLSRPLSGRALDWVRRCNLSGLPIVAVDVPSGLAATGQSPAKHEDAGEAAQSGEPECARAWLTVTFAACEPAHWIGEAARHVGELVVAHIGVPLAAWPDLPRTIFVLDECRVGEWLGDRRSAFSHKGTFGHLMLVAGSEGMSGAAALAARAALRSGVGLLTVATPEAVRSEVAVQVPEAMTLPLRGKELGVAEVELLLRRAERATALGLGPGLGRGAETADAVHRLVSAWPRPMVLDADGLNAFDSIDAIASSRPDRGAVDLVLTPHPGELARLLGCSAEEIQASRLESVREAARRGRCVVVLKGHRTLVASPEGRVWINPTGNAGMATGGSGDVLTGMVAAHLASGLSASVAAASAVWLHGRAGDLALDSRDEEALLPSDLISHLAGARSTLLRPHHGVAR